MSRQGKRASMARMRKDRNLSGQDKFVTTWRPASTFGMPRSVSVDTNRRSRGQSREATPMPYNKLFRYESNPHLYR